MAFGDSEQPIWIRLKSFTVWVLFAVYSIVVIWVNIRLLGILFSDKVETSDE